MIPKDDLEWALFLEATEDLKFFEENNIKSCNIDFATRTYYNIVYKTPNTSTQEE